MKKILLAVILFLPTPLLAQSRAEWFKSLKNPNTGVSCCDVSDCHRTVADWHDGQWWAQMNGQWTPIPKEKVLRTPSIDGEAYLCSSASGVIYCFVEPATSF